MRRSAGPFIDCVPADALLPPVQALIGCCPERWTPSKTPVFIETICVAYLRKRQVRRRNQPLEAFRGACGRVCRRSGAPTARAQGRSIDPRRRPESENQATHCNTMRLVIGLVTSLIRLSKDPRLERRGAQDCSCLARRTDISILVSYRAVDGNNGNMLRLIRGALVGRFRSGSALALSAVLPQSRTLSSGAGDLRLAAAPGAVENRLD